MAGGRQKATGAETKYYTYAQIAIMDSTALSDQAVGKRYVILPGNQGSTPDDLEFLEYARYLETVLRPLGFAKAGSDKDADRLLPSHTSLVGLI